MSWRFPRREVLLLLHDESLAEHGGAPGQRDAALFDSALARPQHLLAYGDPDVAALAASCGYGIARNHPFVDGNKRTAFLATGLILALNGWRLDASQAQATLTMLAVASGEFSESEYADWLRAHATPRKPVQNKK